MTDTKDAERLATIRLQNDGLPTVPLGHSDIVFLLRLVDRLTQERDSACATISGMMVERDAAIARAAEATGFAEGLKKSLDHAAAVYRDNAPASA